MDPLSITASALTVAHVLSKVIRVGNAAYKSEDEKKAFNDLVGNLSVQIEGLQAIEERALKNRDDPRYAGFHAILESSKQFQNGKDAEPDPTGTSPGVLQRLVYAMDKMETRLESKQGFRASVKRLRWLKEREEFEETIAEIKQWTEVVNTVLRYGDHMRIIDIDENASDTNARVKHLEDEAAKAAEDRRLAAGERERAAVREEKKAADKAMKLRELRRLEIVRWISPLKFRERHYAILNQAPASITKPELLQTEEFDLWIRGRPWILHCEGKPGAGKVGKRSYEPCTGIVSHSASRADCIADLTLRPRRKTS